MGCKVSSMQRVSVHARNADNVNVDNKHINIAQNLHQQRFALSLRSREKDHERKMWRKKRAQPVNVRVG